jgi:4-alpha-glucanotransferase
VPGTRDEHANWQRKMTATIDEIFTRDTARALFADMCRARPG